MDHQYKKMNGIVYKFSEKEIEAIAKLLKMARKVGKEGQELSEIVAGALNRNAFKSIYDKQNK